MCVESWWHPRGEAIHALAYPLTSPQVAGVRHYARAAPMLYVAAGQNEISCWDLDEFKCRQVQAPSPDCSLLMRH